MKYLTSGRILFSALFVVIFAILIVTAMGYNSKARTFPLIVAIPVLIGTVGNLIMEVRAVRRGEKVKKEKSEPALPAGVAVAPENKKKEKVSGDEKRKRELIGVVWIFAYVLSIALVGFPIATIGYMILFVRFYNRESWKLTLIYTGLLWAFIWVAFVFFLKSNLYEGLVFEWLGI